MLKVSQNSGYVQSVKRSLSSGRNGSKPFRKKQGNKDILLDINSMISRLDQLQEAIQNRQFETKEQLKNYLNESNFSTLNNFYNKENIETENRRNKHYDIMQKRSSYQYHNYDENIYKKDILQQKINILNPYT